jgi:hypothetical protein
MPNTEIRCDRTGCGWSKDVDIDDLKEGMKCEKCGSVVVNEADMQVVKNMKKLIKLDKMYRFIVPKRFLKNVEVEVETVRAVDSGGIAITEKTLKVTDLEGDK